MLLRSPHRCAAAILNPAHLRHTGNGKPSHRDAGVASMDSEEVEGRQFTVALLGGRRFRERCLARYLAMSGVRIAIGASGGSARKPFISEGKDRSRGHRYGRLHLPHPIIASMVGCLREALPEAPLVVVSDREDRG